MSFATAAARLRGLVQGTFRGIEVLRARLLAADRLGVRAGLSRPHAR